MERTPSESFTAQYQSENYIKTVILKLGKKKLLLLLGGD